MTFRNLLSFCIIYIGPKVQLKFLMLNLHFVSYIFLQVKASDLICGLTIELMLASLFWKSF